jgi:hypothetical protein
MTLKELISGQTQIKYLKYVTNETSNYCIYACDEYSKFYGTKIWSKVVPVHVMKAYGWMEVELCSFLVSAQH